MKKIGLALGGGGAKGLAHIPLLEVFDELQIRPYRLAGTSIGSIVGALFASGLKAHKIRERINGMVIGKEDSLREIFKKRDALKWFEFMDLDFRGDGILKGDKFISFLYESIGVERFEDLEIPLKVVASDFWASKQVILQEGLLLPAVKASMGLPGIFTPVVRDGIVLIDGGGVNPVPHDVLDDCDLVIAIDVMGCSKEGENKIPHPIKSVLRTFDIMQNSIIAEKLKNTPPDIYIKPSIEGVDILDFHKANIVYKQTESARRELKNKLLEIIKS